MARTSAPKRTRTTQAAPAPTRAAKAKPAAGARPGEKAKASKAEPSKRRASKRRASKGTTRPAGRHEGRPRRRRTALWLALGSVVLVGLLFAFVYPTRTFLDQRDDTQRARAQLELLTSENAKLTAEAKQLQDPAEIERRARDYGLVKPGEQGYVIVPAPTAPPTTASAGGTATPSP